MKLNKGKEIALKENNPDKLIEIIDKYNLEENRDVINHLIEISDDGVETSYYIRKKK